MIVSEETQAKLKTAQLARVAAKAKDIGSYPALYASTPEQQRKAAVYRTQRQAARALRLAAQVVADSDADGAIATFGNMEVAMKQGSGMTAGAKENK